MSKLAKIYQEIPFEEFLKPWRNNSYYGAKALMWIDIVTDLLGERSLRDKETFLANLLKHDKLNLFLKEIGINVKYKKSPKKTTFFDYKEKVNFKKFSKYQEKFLQEKLNQSDISEIKKKYDLKDKYVHLAIDGKDIRNTKTKTINNKETNIKNINYLLDGEIISTEFTPSEQTYIKMDLEADLMEISRNIKAKTKKK